MSGHHVLELLDQSRSPRCERRAHLEIAIFDKILAICYLWRDAMISRRWKSHRRDRLLRLQPGMCRAIRDRLAQESDLSHCFVDRDFCERPAAFLRHARPRRRFADGRIFCAKFSRRRPRLSLRARSACEESRTSNPHDPYRRTVAVDGAQIGDGAPRGSGDVGQRCHQVAVQFVFAERRAA